MSTPKTALILIADGTEEIEFTVTYDTFVRAGIIPTSAFVGDPKTGYATCSRGIRIVPDVQLSQIDEAKIFDVLVIPGGAGGSTTLSQDSGVQLLVRDYQAKNKLVGMICAGTRAALTSALPRQPVTSHPSIREELEKDFDYSDESVVVSGSLVTSRGPGTTFAFALKLVELLVGKEKRDEIAGPMMFPPNGDLTGNY